MIFLFGYFENTVHRFTENRLRCSEKNKKNKHTLTKRKKMLSVCSKKQGIHIDGKLDA